MGKIQKMITGVAVTFLCGMAGVVSSITCLAAGESRLFQVLCKLKKLT